jgi:DNA (cytosine-5)-methyltransferase 1
MKYLSICSGIEAASVAWHPLGWEPLAFSEIEAFPRSVLQHHYPDVPLHGDFTLLRSEQWIIDADVLVGGTPCQAFSVAGLRNSLADERGNLTLEFVRLANAIDDLRRDAGRPPAYVLWENVPGVLSVSDNAFGSLLAGLVGHDAPIEPPRGRGWTGSGVVSGPRRVAAWRLLDAQHFGLAQRRKRIFVLAREHPGGWECADALLPIIHSLQGHPAPRREEGERVAPTIARGSPSGGRTFGLCADTAESLVASTGHIAHCLNAGGMGRQGYETETLIAFQSTESMSSGVNVNVAPTLRIGSNGGGQPPAIAFSCKDHGADASDISPTLRAMGHAGSHANAGGQVAVAFAQNSRDEVRMMHVAGALAAEPGAKQQTYAHIGSAVRRLTPRECERLQGFPDDYTLVPHRGKPAADGPRYKSLGNSMAVPVMSWIGERIAAVEAMRKSQTLEAAE